MNEPRTGRRDDAAKGPSGVPLPGSRQEGSDPDDPDGLFDSQDMPTADGEMTDGGETQPAAEEAEHRPPRLPGDQ